MIMPWKLVLIGQMCCKSNFLMFSKTLTVVLPMYCFLKNTLSTRSTKESKIVVVISSIIGKTKVNKLNNHINKHAIAENNTKHR